MNKEEQLLEKRLIELSNLAFSRDIVTFSDFLNLNELNILRAEDENGNTYYLTYDDKVKILDTLFMSGKEVKYSDVRDLLHLKNFGTRKQSNDNRKFNNKYTLYPRICKLIPSLKLDSAIDIFSENEKVKEIEEIVDPSYIVVGKNKSRCFK